MAALAPGLGSPAAASSTPSLATRRPSRLRFRPIDPVPATVDDVTVPAGYSWDPVIRWGDPILAGAPAFDVENQSYESQSGQFGYNNDYLCIMERNSRGTRALLVSNHEYTNEELMFPPGTDPETVIRTAWAAHGMSVVKLRRRRRGGRWKYVQGARANRRFTLDTIFRFDGPAARSDLLKTARIPSVFGSAAPSTTALAARPRGGRCSRGRRTSTSTSTPPGPMLARSATGSARRTPGTGARSTHAGMPPGGLCQRAEPVRMDRRDRPQPPELDAAQAHRDGTLQARGCQRDRQP